MRRRRRQLEVSTFPFLAVLLCTMGSLILLLLVLDRRAKVVALHKAHQDAAELQADKERREQERQRQTAEEERLAAERQAEWERRRLELHTLVAQEEQDLLGKIHEARGQVVAAAAKVQGQQVRADQLKNQSQIATSLLLSGQEAIEAQKDTAAKAIKQTEEAKRELVRQAADLQQLEQTLAQLKALRERQKNTYSLVPYLGRRGDNRRPLYVECAAAGLVFHPDPLALEAPQLTPERIRAEVVKRIAHQREQAPTPPGQETPRSYLLMLVRPDGILHYYAVQAALAGLEVDFGYEFVEQDWVLDFNDAATQPWMTTLQQLPAPSSPRGGGAPGWGPAPALGAKIGSPRAGAAMVPGLPSDQVAALAGGGSPVDAGQPGNGGAGWPGPGPLGPRAPGGAGGPRPVPGLPQFAAGTGDMAWRPQSPPFANVASTGGTAAALDQQGSAGAQAGPPGVGSQPGQPAGRAAGGGQPGLPAGSPTGGALPGQPHGTATSGQPGVGGAPTGAVGQPGDPGLEGGQPGLAGGAPSAGKQTGSPANASDSTGSSPGGSSAGGQPGPPGESGAVGDPPGLPGGGSTVLGPPKSPGGKAPPAPPPLGRLLGNRDWLIYLECNADGVVLKHGNQKFTREALAATTAGESTLAQAVRQLVAKRQATVRPGEPPYRPLLRFQVHPDGLRAYYLAYPLLDSLRLPMARENMER
jgi:hypothetical protein